LQLGDDEMSIETYIQIEGEEITELELNDDELMDVALGINHAQGFDLRKSGLKFMQHFPEME
jgi:hypothetical protein